MKNYNKQDEMHLMKCIFYCFILPIIQLIEFVNDWF